MTKTLDVDASNSAQAQAWDGDEGAYWAEHADEFDLSLRAYHPGLLSAARIASTDRVLDVGCGTGETTRDAARQADKGSALGLDLSTEMLRVARQRAAVEGIRNIDFERADAQLHPLPHHYFDVAISRTGTMFFADLDAAFKNIAQALRPGGRFVQLVWQAPARNEWFLALTGAMAAGRTFPVPPSGHPGPFSLADPQRVNRLLTKAGFITITIDDQRRPMYFGADTDHAYEFVAGMLSWMLEGLDEKQRRNALRDLRATIDSHHTAEGVRYPSATWLVTAERP